MSCVHKKATVHAPENMRIVVSEILIFYQVRSRISRLYFLDQNKNN
jgi:hypothetical protein